MPRDNQGITETDMQSADIIFSDAGINITRRLFRYFAPQDQWELWEIQTVGADVRNLIAKRDSDSGEWVLE